MSTTTVLETASWALRPRRADLDPAGSQRELYDALVAAVAGGYPVPRGAEHYDDGVHDIAGWLAEQDWCAPSDWLAVARLWGGNMLRDHLASQLARKGLVPA
jgi:hypothetical protein